MFEERTDHLNQLLFLKLENGHIIQEFIKKTDYLDISFRKLSKIRRKENEYILNSDE